MLSRIIDRYNYVIETYSDKRVNDWFLMSSPVPTLIMCIMYVLIVKKIGPYLMRDRKPFELRKTLIVYNFIQVVFASWMCWEAWDGAWARDYGFGCEPVDKTESPKAMRLARACWWYYFSKFPEFFDTFFFIMRKKYDQVTTLHIIHHGIMPISVWIGVKFTPGGHSTFFGLLNTFVHVVMYLYYMLAAFGPHMQKYLWWKRHLTLLQMIQFGLVFIHSLNILILGCDEHTSTLSWLIMLHAAMFFFLFLNFYIQSYKVRARKQAAAAQKKKDDEDRANNRPVTGNGVSSQPQEKSFWSNLSTTPCFLPAVTDETTDDAATTYSSPPANNAAPNAYVSDDSLRNRAFVSRSSNA